MPDRNARPDRLISFVALCKDQIRLCWPYRHDGLRPQIDVCIRMIRAAEEATRS